MRILEDQLRHLRSHRAHGNRRVFYDHVVIAHLLAFYNPGLRGLRSIEDIFEHPGVRKRYAVPRLPKSTLADAQAMFDPRLVQPILDSLVQRADIQPHDPRLDEITQQLLATDGSFFAVAPRIAWALYNKSCRKGGANQGHVRTHVQFDVLRAVPVHTRLTDGQASEAEQLRAALKKNCFYVMDRGFQQYTLLADILKIESDFVVRIRKSARAETMEVRPLGEADRNAGVVADRIVTLGWRKNQVAQLPPLRRVEVAFVGRDGQTHSLILLTNRLDLPAWMIALIYRHRWQVELFFRWLKCVANFRHFFSESLEGMTLQVYVTLIGMLLMAIETGAAPSKYDYAIFSAVISGLTTLEESRAVAARRRAERARAAEWQRQYNARRAAQKAGR
jgi:transposase